MAFINAGCCPSVLCIWTLSSTVSVYASGIAVCVGSFVAVQDWVHIHTCGGASSNVHKWQMLSDALYNYIKTCIKHQMPKKRRLIMTSLAFDTYLQLNTEWHWVFHMCKNLYTKLQGTAKMWQVIRSSFYPWGLTTYVSYILMLRSKPSFMSKRGHMT